MLEFKKIELRSRDNFWFIPIIYGFVSIVVVVLLYFLDKWIFTVSDGQFINRIKTNQDIAKELYSSLITAILTMTTISFSVIMVVLTTYSTQFSPRTLKDFMRSEVTRHVLGVYSFGFIYALLNLLILSSEDQLFRPIFMVLFAILNLALFIYFIHTTAKEVQVNHLIALLRKDGGRIIANMEKKEYHFKEYSEWNEQEIVEIEQSVNFTLYAKYSGYVQYIDWTPLFNWAKENKVQIILQINTGDFVLKREALLSAKINDENIGETQLKEQLRKYIILGLERSDEQDFEFIIEKIVEVALKAISPAMNDPHTAINCINRLGSLLIEYGQGYKETRFLVDDEERLTIIKQTKYFDELLYKSFYQLKHYGKSDVSVMYEILEVLYKIADLSDEHIRKHVAMYYQEIIDTIDWESMSRLDKKHLEAMSMELARVCNES